MDEKKDSIIIKSAETDEELCGRGYVHCTAWKEAYRGIVCDRYLDTMTVEATTARARIFPNNTLVAKDQEKGMREPFSFITNMVLNLTDAKKSGLLEHRFQLSE